MIKREKGFTLIEILVVMTIMGILASVGLANFRSSQIKARDVKRKSDLSEVQRGLEMYYNDYGAYPAENQGKIKVSGDVLVWGSDSMEDSKGTIYINILPNDPTGNPEYCYSVSDTGSYYKLYAKLENDLDPKKLNPLRSCNSLGVYNYGVSSSGTTP